MQVINGAEYRWALYFDKEIQFTRSYYDEDRWKDCNRQYELPARTQAARDSVVTELRYKYQLAHGGRCYGRKDRIRVNHFNGLGWLAELLWAHDIGASDYGYRRWKFPRTGEISPYTQKRELTRDDINLVSYLEKFLTEKYQWMEVL
jgi:hypothetical protein